MVRGVRNFHLGIARTISLRSETVQSPDRLPVVRKHWSVNSRRTPRVRRHASESIAPYKHILPVRPAGAPLAESQDDATQPGYEDGYTRKRLSRSVEADDNSVREASAWRTDDSQLDISRVVATDPNNDPDGGLYIVTLTVTNLLHRTLTGLRAELYKGNREAGHICLFRNLPGTILYRVVSDIKSIVTLRDSFPIEAANMATSTERAVRIVFNEGREPARILYKSLWSRWKSDLHQKSLDFNPLFPYVTVWYRERSLDSENGEVDKVLNEVNSRLQDLTTSGGGKAKAVAPLEQGGGTLKGIATGLALFRESEGRLQFMRRFNFNDVPSHGWDSPELLSIPKGEGWDESSIPFSGRRTAKDPYYPRVRIGNLAEDSPIRFYAKADGPRRRR